MYFFKKIFFNIISLLNKQIKKKNIIIFTSFPDASDNSFAVFDYLIKKGKDKKYLMIWLINDCSKISKIKKNINESYGIKNTKCVKRNSFFGIYYYIFSKYIFCTQGIFSGSTLSKKQIKVNLWHGMPLKRIGFLDNKGKEDIATSNYMIATSIIFVDIMAKVFRIDKKNILNIGQPRNDLLFINNKSFEKLGIEKDKYNRVFLWMPTYRLSVVGDIRSDGKLKGYGLPLLTEEEIIRLNDLLYKGKCLFIIKLHPMDKFTAKHFNNLSNIVFVDNNKLIDSNVQLYSLIGESDVLLTDYSSVYFDYLILNRPIGFIIDDFEEYKNNRGFIFKKPDDWMPGEKIKTFEDLENFILDVKNGIDEYREIRKEVNKKVNKFKDDKSSERLINFLGI